MVGRSTMCILAHFIMYRVYAQEDNGSADNSRATLTVANAGDSRCVLCSIRGGKIVGELCGMWFAVLSMLYSCVCGASIQ